MNAVIAAAGLVCPAGLGLAESAAGARARLSALREIDWCDRRVDAATGHVEQSLGQLSIKFAQKFTAADRGGIGGAFAADEDDAGGKCISAGTNHAVAEFGTHRPRAGQGKASTNHRF